MVESTPTQGDVIVFNVDYDGGIGGSSNPELKGRGQLAIDPQGPVYSFTGLRRRLLSSERITVELGAHDIANVIVEDRTIHFAARPRAPGAPVRAFVFHCADETDALRVASFLPATQLQGFVESHDFISRLNTLSTARPPWATVTNLIIALNVVAFVVLAGVFNAGWVTANNLMPYIRYGANNGAATTDGEWWRLVTSMFMHFGILHIGLNMWALWNTGPFLEKLQGRALFAITYLGSGLAGGFVSILWNGDKAWSAGASGAIFGVIGGIIGFLLREKQRVPRGILQAMMRNMLTFVALNIFLGFSIHGIDNADHLGGLTGGFALSWLLAMPVDREARRRLIAGRVVTGLLAIAAIVAAGVKFTPRFDYRIADEIALSDALADLGPREEQLLKEYDKAVATLKRDGNTEAFADWVDRVGVPFYRAWSDRFKALDLAGGRRTADRREQLLEILRLKIDAYRNLAADLRAGRSGAFQTYLDADRRISGMIRNLGQDR